MVEKKSSIFRLGIYLCCLKSAALLEIFFQSCAPTAFYWKIFAKKPVLMEIIFYTWSGNRF